MDGVDTLLAHSGDRKERASKANEDDSLQEPGFELIICEKDEEIKSLKQKLEENVKKRGYQDEKLITKIKELQNEVELMEQKCKTSNTELGEVKFQLEQLQGDHNIVYLGEMCRKLQENIYRYVLPDKIKISPKVCYKIKNLDEDIEKRKNLTEQERRDAKKRWEELKQQVNPGKFNTIIDGIQKMKNTSAHPEIRGEIEREVSEAAKELHEDGTLDFIASLEDVNELIGIWKTTEDLVEKNYLQSDPYFPLGQNPNSTMEVGTLTRHEERSGGRKRRASEGNEDDSQLQEQGLELIAYEDDEIESLKKKVEEYAKKCGYQDKKINELMTKIEELKKEVDILKQKCETSKQELEEVESKYKELEKKFKELQGDRSILYLGEMCRKLQENVYRHVFPDKIPISPKVSYKIKNLDEDIETRKKLTKQEREDAKERWEELKQDLNPGKFHATIDEIQELRNNSAHPEIRDEIEGEVSKAAKELDEEGAFEFTKATSLENVNELIRIWKTTEEKVRARENAGQNH